MLASRACSSGYEVAEAIVITYGCVRKVRTLLRMLVDRPMTPVDSRERECRELCLAPDTCFDDLFAEEDGSGGQRGIMWGRLVLSERAFLSVLELVVVVESGIHREEYSYYLIIDGYEVWGYDRDPDHDPPEHMHCGSDHTRDHAGRVTFCQVAEKAWETLSQEEHLAAWSDDS